MASLTKVMCQTERNSTLYKYDINNTQFDLKSNSTVIGLFCNPGDQIIRVEGGNDIM